MSNLVPESEQQYGSILTVLGENAEQNGKLLNKQIEFTHIAFGDANDTYVQPDRKSQALVNELHRIPVNSVDVLQPTPDSVPILKVEAILPDNINDVVIREFAAVATFNGQTHFHAIGNCARIYVPKPLNNGNVSNPVILEMTFVITSADPIVEVDPNVVTASREYVIANAVTRIETVAKLRSSIGMRNGQTVEVGGYYSYGDDGGGAFFWDAESNEVDNEGTVIMPTGWTKPGRWKRKSVRRLSLYHFGVFNADQSCHVQLKNAIEVSKCRYLDIFSDIRLSEMVATERDRITVNLNNQYIRWNGVAPTEDRAHGMIKFFGKKVGNNQTVPLTENLKEFSTVWPVLDSTKFKKGEFWRVENGTAPKKVNYIVEIAGIVDSTTVKVHYRLGWELKSGDTLTWTKVDPVKHAHVKNGHVIDETESTRETAVSPVSLMYAVKCSVDNLKGSNTFWPLVFTLFTNRCRVEKLELDNPQSTGGGEGYLVQWNSALYHRTIDCHSYGDRHIHDVTMGAFGRCIGCTSTNTKNGSYTTHGAYEHDQYYESCVGLLSFANSGPEFGERTKRVTVVKHQGEKLFAYKGVIDLTLIDVHISDTAEINVDGFVSTNLTVGSGVSFCAFTNESYRRSLVEGGSLVAWKGKGFTQESMYKRLEFESVVIKDIDGHLLLGPGEVLFNDCNLWGIDNADTMECRAGRIVMNGGGSTNVAFRFMNDQPQELVLTGGAKMTGSPSSLTLIDCRKTGGTFKLKLGDCEVSTTNPDCYLYDITANYDNQTLVEVHNVGATLEGGKIRADATVFSNGKGYLYQKGCVEKSVFRMLPTEPNIVVDDNLILVA
ncbi:phage tail protein [Vibrio parahaemolyticus]|uniref:phage tail-collar fiber domain-containing protein n=1 Tax=Vibrio parahaemolyticus TaxID=670 RepID=UPI001FAD2B71|nr:phage tail protein [Vibrio parahaemolyticus]